MNVRIKRTATRMPSVKTRLGASAVIAREDLKVTGATNALKSIGAQFYQTRYNVVYDHKHISLKSLIFRPLLYPLLS